MENIENEVFTTYAFDFAEDCEKNASDLSDLSDEFEISDEESFSEQEDESPKAVLSLNDVSFYREMKWVNVPNSQRPKAKTFETSNRLFRQVQSILTPQSATAPEETDVCQADSYMNEENTRDCNTRSAPKTLYEVPSSATTFGGKERRPRRERGERSERRERGREKKEISIATRPPRNDTNKSRDRLKTTDRTQTNEHRNGSSRDVSTGRDSSEPRREGHESERRRRDPTKHIPLQDDDVLQDIVSDDDDHAPLRENSLEIAGHQEQSELTKNNLGSNVERTRSGAMLTSRNYVPPHRAAANGASHERLTVDKESRKERVQKWKAQSQEIQEQQKQQLEAEQQRPVSQMARLHTQPNNTTPAPAVAQSQHRSGHSNAEASLHPSHPNGHRFGGSAQVHTQAVSHEQQTPQQEQLFRQQKQRDPHAPTDIQAVLREVHQLQRQKIEKMGVTNKSRPTDGLSAIEHEFAQNANISTEIQYRRQPQQHQFSHQQQQQLPHNKFERPLPSSHNIQRPFPQPSQRYHQQLYDTTQQRYPHNNAHGGGGMSGPQGYYDEYGNWCSTAGVYQQDYHDGYYNPYTDDNSAYESNTVAYPDQLTAYQQTARAATMHAPPHPHVFPGTNPTHTVDASSSYTSSTPSTSATLKVTSTVFTPSVAPFVPSITAKTIKAEPKLNPNAGEWKPPSTVR